MANLLVQVKFSCMKTQSFISNTFLLFRVPTWPTWRKDLTRAVLDAFSSSGTRIWRPTFPTPSGRKRICWRKNIQGAYDVQNDDGVLGDLPDWGAGDLLGGPAEHQEDEVQPGRQPCRPACQVRIHFLENDHKFCPIFYLEYDHVLGEDFWRASPLCERARLEGGDNILPRFFNLIAFITNILLFSCWSVIYQAWFFQEMEKDFDSWLQKQECDITFKWEWILLKGSYQQKWTISQS